MLNPNIKIWNGMIEAGVPKVHIEDIAKKHLVDLEKLPLFIEGREQAIAEVKAFISDNFTDNTE